MKKLIICLLLIWSCCLTVKSDNKSLKIDFFQKHISDKSVSVKKKLAYYDSLITLSAESKKREFLRGKARLCIDAGMYGQALNIYVYLDSLAIHSTNEAKCSAGFGLAHCLYLTGNYTTSIQKAVELITKAKEDSLEYFNVKGLILISDNLIRLQQFKLAKKYLEEVHQLMNKDNFKNISKNTRQSIQLAFYASRGCIYINEKNYTKALDEFNRALGLTNDTDKIQSIMGNIALIYHLSKEFPMAEKYYKKTLTKPISSVREMAILTNYMDMLNACGRYEDTKKQYLINKNGIDSLPTSIFTGYIYANLSDAYANQGLYKEGFNLLKQYNAINDSVLSANKNGNINRLLFQLESTELLNDKLKLEKLISARNIIIALSILAFIIVLLLRGKVVFQKKRLQKEKEKISDLHDKVLAEKAVVVSDLDDRNREICAIVNRLAQINDVIDNIMKETNNENNTKEKRLSNIQALIKKLALTESSWDIFKSFLSSVNRSFFDRLYEKHPDLTKGEIRMCAFILLNLTTKEIAELTNRSVRTVDTIRHNLRKKLGISEPTPSYLKRLAGEQTVDHQANGKDV